MSQPLLVATLLIVLVSAAAGLLFFLDPAGDEGGATAPAKGVRSEVRDPAQWDLGLVPPLASPAIKTWTTPSGTLVERFALGEDETAAPGRPISLRMRSWLLTGHPHEPRVHEGVRIETLDSRFPKGIAEGLADLRLRERRRLRVPSEVAFGERGGPGIPPHSDLIVEVEWARIQIIDLAKGTGEAARRGRSRVLVAYRGTLPDGTVFDSRANTNPIEFPLRDGGLIKGWLIGIDGMRVGGKRKLWIPWHLAYGKKGSGQKIGPYQDLEFVVELMGVKPM